MTWCRKTRLVRFFGHYEAGCPVVARLKDSLPELFQAAQRRFRFQPPHLRFRDGPHQVEL